MNRSEQIKTLLRERILVMDGAMGTMIQEKDPSAADFGGDALEGCNENLNITRPDLIQSIHETYFAAGADIVETNTFGGMDIVLAEYDLQEKVSEINRAGARLARAAAEKCSTLEKPRFVAGSMGPTTKAITVTGGVTFDELVASSRLQSIALIEGGVDLLLLETAQDTLNLKAAVIGLLQAEAETERALPIMVSATIERTGTMLAGQGVESLYTSLEHLPLLSIGLNCATGPEFMTDHIRSLDAMASTMISIYPNAGLPDEEGLYEETPESLASKLLRFVEAGWVNIIGGCCGTTPAHITAIAEMVKGQKPRLPKETLKTAVSGIDFLQIEEENRPIIVGERANVIGSRKFKKMIVEEKFEEGAEIGRSQVKNGAQVLDVCMANPDREELSDIDAFLNFLTKKIRVPIMIDSTDDEVAEAALKLCQGKCIINSINLEEGEARFEKVVPLLKKYGGAVVVGCIDEDPDQGMGVTCERKLEIALRSYKLLVEKYHIAPRDIIFDPLVFPVGTGDENYIGSARETIEGIRAIKEALPEVKTILGVSNVSFGLPPAGREVLNSVFLYHTVRAGLDYAIVNSEKLERYPSIPEKERLLSEDLLFWRGEDPIARFAVHFRDKKVSTGKEKKVRLPLDERLAQYIIEGTKDGLTADIDLKLKENKPLDIINGPLMTGMDEVGRLFNLNELIVAEVLQSAEAMKAAVRHLEPSIDKNDAASRGKMVLATVKGDVHDIGKNLVEIILGNNGYEIVNLGIKVAPNVLIDAVRKENPDMIGLSGLLVKSAQQMTITAQDLKNAGIKLPILVGGAALTPRFTGAKIAPKYTGPVLYAKDAMDGLKLANLLTNAETRPKLLARLETDQSAIRKNAEGAKKRPAPSPERVFPSSVRHGHALPKAPDFIHHVIKEGPLREIFDFINPAMLYGKHLGLKGNISRLLAEKDEKAEKLFATVEALKEEILSKKYFTAKGVYRFFPCKSKGNDLMLYEPSNPERPLETFHFLRQQHGDHLCLSDFCRRSDHTEIDTIALFVVTTGHGIHALSESWKNEGDYLRSHLLQAIAIEGAEGFAEWLHRKIRSDWGIGDPNGMTIADTLKNKYRGVRVSFGYPACPDMSDQQKLFRLLNVTAEIGVELTEGDMMDPEATVSALTFHHPDARYFRVDK
ncbi:MAG: methionine synthase [Nitrospira sp.]|nr:methionine synthase [Candidatus Manganitrophaceae bacterium]HIL34079.1 methionine synthase [Candidatus Manganitrophaceae bacterium]